ncbi:class I SAM-dependent DNA methyltransferase [Pseudopedobacter beijingensis]|uniref:site-specific DNA-methyltransferase (adenine-specific) n=1 Tax=Pseudopedobacter beijingensis TaxID=1207056 RepID=A0ABW4IEA0_9SPHI
MKKSEIQQNLQQIINNIDEENFIYNFLLAFGLSKTTITRLKKGDYNLSNKEGELFYKSKIFFKIEETGNLLNKIDELSKSDKVLKHRPRFIFLTDFKTIIATDTKLKTNKDFSFSELPKYIDFFLPLSGAEIYRVSTDNKADREAAYKLGELYEILVTDNQDWIAEGSHQLNIFLSRLLFCFFAEDTGIFNQKSIFIETLVNNTKEDGSDIDKFLNLLFKKLNSETNDFPDYLQKFPYVNGGLFKDSIKSPKFTKKSRNILVSSGELDWSEINPDIFGSMIQAVADPIERSDLGMHYTSVPNILKLIRPLFLDELEEEFEKNFDNYNGLRKLINRISKIKFFDPACGSGNFLIITYKEIRAFEIKIIKRLIDLIPQGQTIPIYFTSIQLSQFYGIEIKDFAHEMAILSLWLAEHQMNQVFETELLDYGQVKPILPLKQAGNIICGNATRINWEIVCSKSGADEIYIIGNPPYYGARKQDNNQKEDIEFNFGKGKGSNNLDYISIWFYKGSKYIEGINASLAFVSTNSICQGEQVSLLWPKIFKINVEISFAYYSYKWTNNAKGNAGVTVVIIGLTNKTSKQKYLYLGNIKREAKNINAYLLDYKDIYVVSRLKPLSRLPEMNFGNMANDGGYLFLTSEEREDLIKQNPETLKYIKKLYGSLEFIRGLDKYCLWIEDKDLDYASSINFIKNRIKGTQNSRLQSKRKATNKLAAISHKFAEIRHQNSEAIFIPSVSSEKRNYIPLGFLNKDDIIVAPNLAIYDAQPWLFGVLHSKMHMIWVDAIGGKLETRYRYSAKLCYNTFPFPNISEKQKEIINQYVFAILDERAKYQDKTIAWMYNPETMPLNLKKVHQELDEAIERIYRLAPFNSDAERLEYLFKLYEEMIKKDTLFAKEKKVKKKKIQ